MPLPPSGYNGQKYRVTFQEEGSDKRRTIGWCDNPTGGAFVASINSHPSWHSPRVAEVLPTDPERIAFNAKVVEFKGDDDPEANGRKAVTGDRRYTLKFPLEDGRELRVHVGRSGMNHFAGMIAQCMADDAAEGEQTF